MIVVVGEALVDLVIGLDATVGAALGGAPFNTARTCGRLGAAVAFMGAVSDDRFGIAIAEQLAADHVSTQLVQRVGVPTTLAAAELDAAGAATYRFYTESTSAPALRPAVLPAATHTLFAGGLGLVLEPMAGTVVGLVERAGDDVMVVLDLNCRPAVIDDRGRYLLRVDAVLERADVVKASEEDLEYITPNASPIDAARRLLGRGPDAVLLTAGGAHVTVLTADGQRVVPVEPVRVVDTIGAGDAFAGGFIAWWTGSGRRRTDLADVAGLACAAAAANRVAGVACTRRGADPPWRHELPLDWDG